MNISSIVELVIGTIGGGVISAIGVIITYRNYKKSTSNADDTLSLEKVKEVADRQIDAHKEELTIATTKLQDALSELKTAKAELRANRAEIDELHRKATTMRDGYERKIKSLEVENKQLRSRCRYLENQVTSLKNKERK
ncbi:hypothetical protein [Apilactobacillus timberlakei]|uniref:hypothetical protein n=1 Tax=Apilactobacillus timberlakei TaxID=2008380 RepID=UPI00112BE58C|nr:hypothetical protein [Apilactobacillus timberlakei]TPR16695.1 hypothetical protein DYZ95_07585 [Apilactobacillus timberlakei]